MAILDNYCNSNGDLTERQKMGYAKMCDAMIEHAMRTIRKSPKIGHAKYDARWILGDISDDIFYLACRQKSKVIAEIMPVIERRKLL